MGKNLLRRRVLNNAQAGGSSTDTNDYPVLAEYGVYNFLVTNVNINTSVDTFIKSGSNSYNRVAVFPITQSFTVTIDRSTILLNVGNTYQSVAFAGFPVRIKRCNGTESDSPLVTFNVVKIS